MADIANLRRTTLDNGLEILLYPGFDAPVASFWVWYRVGSRNELPGQTGVTHWVEHMMFKGTPSVGPGELMLTVNSNGGELNAFTSYDYTAYHQTLPADRVRIAVELEADRMVNLSMDPDETESERTVILSERQGVFNNPSYVLWDETLGTAFRAHSYRHFVIGTEHDLRTMSRDDLYGYYRRFYAPNNAVVVATGAFDADQMEATISESFGRIPAAELVIPTTVREAPMVAERRIELMMPAPAPEVLIAFHAPPSDHPDAYAAEVLAAVLSGAGGRMGRSARLPRALVATGKARAASLQYLRGIDPFAFLVAGTALPDGNAHELDELLMRQIAQVSDRPISETELARAKKQLITSFRYGSESVTEQASGIGTWAMLGDPEQFFTYPDDVNTVTVDDVQRVAQTYLTPKRRTVGFLTPTEASAGGPNVPTIAALRFGLAGPGAPALQPFEREAIDDRLVVLTQPQPNDPVVAARIRLPVGSGDDPVGKFGLAHVTAQMVLRGSRARTREALEDAADELGASIGISAGREHTEVAITCLAEDLPASLELAGEALLNPVFDPEQLEVTRREAIAAVKQAEDNTMSVADQTARELLFPEDHPLRHRSTGSIPDLQSLTVDDLAVFHRDVLVATGLTAAIVGGFADTATMVELLGKHLSGVGSDRPKRQRQSVDVPAEGRRKSVTLAGKEQADVALMFPVMGVGEDGFYDFDVADTIMGQYGMMGRIGDSVRQRQGLAYYAYSNTSPHLGQSIWHSRAGVDPANVDRAIESIIEVINDVASQGLTAAELDGARRLMTGRLALAMQTNAGIAQMLLTIEELELGLDYVDRYPALLEAVTLDSARAAIADWLAPNRFVIGVAGPPAT
jgi:zinc protease